MHIFDIFCLKLKIFVKWSILSCFDYDELLLFNQIHSCRIYFILLNEITHAYMLLYKILHQFDRSHKYQEKFLGVSLWSYVFFFL